jgi:hypothetical protein
MDQIPLNFSLFDYDTDEGTALSATVNPRDYPLIRHERGRGPDAAW